VTVTVFTMDFIRILLYIIVGAFKYRRSLRLCFVLSTTLDMSSEGKLPNPLDNVEPKPYREKFKVSCSCI
jgi:hypothetical protein